MYNQITLIGNVGRDPELKYVNDGIAVANFSVAVTLRNSQSETTDWYEITCWRKQAETVANAVRKGQRVLVSGQLTLKTYQNRDNQTVSKLAVEAHNVIFLSPKDTTPPLPQSGSEVPF